MKRCAAIAIQKALKELNKAKKNAGSTWDEVIQLEVHALENLLIFTRNSDLLSTQRLKELAKIVASNNSDLLGGKPAEVKKLELEKAKSNEIRHLQKLAL